LIATVSLPEQHARPGIETGGWRKEEERDMTDNRSDYQERPVTHTTVIEKRGGGGTTIAILLLVVVVAVAAFFLISSQTSKDNAVSTAAQQVGDAASDVGDAARDAAGSVKKD
jgi:uncharacterized protein HemX